MKKLIVLFVMLASVVSTQAMTSNTVARLAKSRIGRAVLREQLRQRRMEILGLASPNAQLPIPGEKKVLLGSAPAKPRMTFKLGGKDSWEYTVTTNALGEITKVATKGTNVVMMVWNNHIVPMRYRTIFPTLSDAQRDVLASEIDEPWTDLPPSAEFLHPKKAEKKDTDENITEEIREINVRGW